MRYRTIFILSLLLAFATATMAAPAPRNMEGSKVPMKKMQIAGTVESVEGQKAIIQTESGRRVNVDLGPQKYWQDRGYRLDPGAHIRVQGWVPADDDRGPFFAGGIWGPGFHFELTNDAGYPYWGDPNDYDAGWAPTWDNYYYYYCGPSGPPAWWSYGPPPPPPPRWWYRHHGYGWRGWRGWHGRPYWYGRHWDRDHGAWHRDRGDWRDRDGGPRGGWQDNDDHGNGRGNGNGHRGGRRGG